MYGEHSMTPAQHARSESDLSDLQDSEVIEPTAARRQVVNDSMVDVVHEMETSESDGEEDAEGEDDADYDSETPPLDKDAVRRLSTSSSDSIRPAKRKAQGDGEDFMEQNPELYGLRRSVCICTTTRLFRG